MLRDDFGHSTIVFGKPRAATTTSHRNAFLFCLVGFIAVLLVLAISGKWTFIACVGGFLGGMIGSGVQWRRRTRSSAVR